MDVMVKRLGRLFFLGEGETKDGESGIAVLRVPGYTS